MKIIISVNGKNDNAVLDPRFGRCQYFAVCDENGDVSEFVENPGISSAHGAGITAANKIVEIGADVVITGNLGPNALRVLQASNIRGYASSQLSIKEAVEMYKDGKLSEISMPGPAHHGA
jgi:predicted Fe-Mo cluster-binding NifX family protein